jgi:hypothetical protein
MSEETKKVRIQSARTGNIQFRIITFCACSIEFIAVSVLGAEFAGIESLDAPNWLPGGAHFGVTMPSGNHSCGAIQTWREKEK